MSQTMYGKPPVAKTMGKCMSPRRVELRGLTAPSAESKRSDIIRLGSARPSTPMETVGDPGTSMSIKTFSCFSKNRLFSASVIPVREVNCPMDRSRVMSAVRKNREKTKIDKETEHINAVRELAALSAAPRSYFKPNLAQVTSTQGYVHVGAPDPVIPRRAATPASSPTASLAGSPTGSSSSGLLQHPRPHSRYTSVQIMNRTPSSRPSTAQNYSTSSQLSTLKLSNFGGNGGGNGTPLQKPPLSRPASAFSAASAVSATNMTAASSASYRPLSANGIITPQQSLLRQQSEVKLNEMLRSSSPMMEKRPASNTTTTSNSMVRPLRSFVS